MKSLLFYTAVLLLIEYGLGYALARKLMPKTLVAYAVYLGPWILNILVILMMVETSLLGIPGKYIAWIILFVGTGMIISILKRVMIKPSQIAMLLLVSAIVLISNSPLIFRDKFLTTISLGNNDVIAYATNADYLVNNSIRGSFSQDVSLTIANLLHDGYRWGTPLLQTFFLSIMHTESWKVTYLIQTVIFATMLPLTFVLYRLWYGEKTLVAWIIPVMVAFNSNLIYMLYHNFYGQVVFWGIELILLILITEYWRKPTFRLEWLIGGSIAAMYMAYHEPALFVLVPLLGGAVLHKNWKGVMRIAGITSLFAGVSIINAIGFDFGQAFQANPNQPIGWQLFRNVNPMANPWEILGLSSVHTAPPLPPWLAWGGSLACVGVVLLGIVHSRFKAYVGGMMGFFALMFYWMSIGGGGNWFVFNRAFTYVLPVLIVVFGGGLSQLKAPLVKWGVLTVATILMVNHGIRLNYKFINSHLSVQAWYQTLKEVREMKVQESIYTTSMISPYISIWDQIWIGYFLYHNVDELTLPTKPFSKNSLVLLNKSTPWVRYPSYLSREKYWDNPYYELSRPCIEDDCLLNNSLNLNGVMFGESDYEDSLLGKGWSYPEYDGRWIEGKQAEIKLVTTTELRYGKLFIELRAMLPDTRLEVVIDGKPMANIKVGTDWQFNEFTTNLNPGVHSIVLIADQEVSPNQLGIGNDLRKLSVRLRSIRFQSL